MTHEDFDRTLSSEQEIIPSSGFVASVMDAVQREATAPPPVPFPWKRALPGLLAASVALIALFVAGVALFTQASTPQPAPPELLSALNRILEIWKSVRGNWIVLSLALTMVALKLSMRFLHRRI
jgi:hypothetical protein